MPEVLLHAALGATVAVLLTGLLGVLGIGRRSGPLDLGCLASIVAATISGSEIGRAAGQFGVGLVFGAVVGAILATVLRRVAARA